jgi:hypothetical protein
MRVFAIGIEHALDVAVQRPVCNENLNPDIVMMKPAKDGV